MKKFLLTIFCFMCLCSVSFGQSIPSLKETQDWIANKLCLYMVENNSIGGVECVVFNKESMIVSGLTNQGTKMIIIPIGSIKSFLVTQSKLSFKSKTGDGNFTVATGDVDGYNTKVKKIYGYDLEFSKNMSEDMITRLTKAFNTLLSFYGNKVEEPF